MNRSQKYSSDIAQAWHAIENQSLEFIERVLHGEISSDLDSISTLATSLFYRTMMARYWWKVMKSPLPNGVLQANENDSILILRDLSLVGKSQLKNLSMAIAEQFVKNGAFLNEWKDWNNLYYLFEDRDVIDDTRVLFEYTCREYASQWMINIAYQNLCRLRFMDKDETEWTSEELNQVHTMVEMKTNISLLGFKPDVLICDVKHSTKIFSSMEVSDERACAVSDSTIEETISMAESRGFAPHFLARKMANAVLDICMNKYKLSKKVSQLWYFHLLGKSTKEERLRLRESSGLRLGSTQTHEQQEKMNAGYERNKESLDLNSNAKEATPIGSKNGTGCFLLPLVAISIIIMLLSMLF